ncbi:hypothetical protein PT974_02993 [Cladobotryum mycophilum]|uniref:Ecp2 effector protein domain-containing protein n=1 Tax=Cladobotryum mycophilum TaxID=491253 RepID=A0ABR0SZS5_9HYPO
MVNFAASALALMALAPVIGAVPTADSTFSFTSWVEDIIANPKGQHLSPEGAVSAAALNDKGSLEKRVTCNGGRTAPVNDAVSCINQLAREGGECALDGGVDFCTIGGAKIIGRTGGGGPVHHSVDCNEIARTAGKIMDACTTGNVVSGSEYVPSDVYINVIISGF